MNWPAIAASVLAELERRGMRFANLTSDSRLVKPGDAFFAYPGDESDGRDYIGNAVANGARVVLWEAKEAKRELIEVPNMAVLNLRELAGHLADQVYDQPSRKLWTAGVTGTNGKTTVSQWIARACSLLGRRCGVIGTLGNGFPDKLHASPNTTPDAIVLQRELAAMVEAEAWGCAMEVSSIGIDQGRINGAHFDAAILTNLTRDHLDYHGDMVDYARAKEEFFRFYEIGTAVVNLDDAFGRYLCAELRGRVRCIGYSLAEEAPGARVDELLHGKLSLSPAGLSLQVREHVFATPLIGRFNAANLLAVLGGLRAAGIGLAEAAPVIGMLRPPPGRMQRLGGEAQPLVVIDYAHTPDALEQVLRTLREMALIRGGRLWCVFGCGGNRDPGKRPLMGAVAASLADVAVVTSDNPRNEEPEAIIAAIRQGMPQHGVRVEAERGAAIAQCIGEAAAADVVLIAGKGHEDYQEIAGVRHAFSDLAHAEAALETRS